MDATTLLILLLMVMAAMAIGTPIVLITLAAFIYVWTMAYPWLKMVGKWAAKPANFIALLFVYLVMLLIVMALAVLIHPILFLLILPALIILFPVTLAVVVWEVRLVKFTFTGLSGVIDGLFLAARLEFIKLKIRTDALKEGGSKGKLGALRREFADDASAVTTRVSTKKQGGIRGKLEALRGEFSSDVDKARSRFTRKK
jgi:hypothetical protein